MGVAMSMTLVGEIRLPEPGVGLAGHGSAHGKGPPCECMSGAFDIVYETCLAESCDHRREDVGSMWDKGVNSRYVFSLNTQKGRPERRQTKGYSVLRQISICTLATTHTSGGGDGLGRCGTAAIRR